MGRGQVVGMGWGGNGNRRGGAEGKHNKELSPSPTHRQPLGAYHSQPFTIGMPVYLSCVDRSHASSISVLAMLTFLHSLQTLLWHANSHETWNLSVVMATWSMSHDICFLHHTQVSTLYVNPCAL